MTLPAAAIRKMAEYGLDALKIAEIGELIEANSPRSNGLPDSVERRRAYDRKYAKNKREAEQSRTTIGRLSDDESAQQSDDSRTISDDFRPRVRDNPSSQVLTGKKETTPEAKASSVGQTPKSRFCPDTWLPNATTLIAIDATTFTPSEVERELAKFRDHQFRDAHTDWDAAFRNWIRTANERRPQSANGQSAKFAARQANLERSARGFEAAVRYRDASGG